MMVTKNSTKKFSINRKYTLVIQEPFFPYLDRPNLPQSLPSWILNHETLSINKCRSHIPYQTETSDTQRLFWPIPNCCLFPILPSLTCQHLYYHFKKRSVTSESQTKNSFLKIECDNICKCRHNLSNITPLLMYVVLSLNCKKPGHRALQVSFGQ